MNSSAYPYTTVDAGAGDALVRGDELPEISAGAAGRISWGIIVTPHEGTGSAGSN